MEFKTICICGAGTMGSGIAQVFITAGYNTLLFDVNSEMLEKGEKSIRAALQKQVDKGKLQLTDLQQLLQKLKTTSEIKDCSAELFIEAIVENHEAKVSLFRQLMEFNAEESLFCTNTSSLSITEIATELPARARVLGLHFFNPAPLMRLVEIIKTDYTSQGTIEKISQMIKSIGKTAVVCKDSPGFVVNRVARPFYLEALRIAEEQHLAYEAIDRIMEAQGFKMGPFRLMDLIGNDINYAVSNSIYEQLKRPMRLKPSLLQKQKVEQGELGRKTGKGYYDY